jgi:hypothetical protein
MCFVSCKVLQLHDLLFLRFGVRRFTGSLSVLPKTLRLPETLGKAVHCVRLDR